MSLQEYKIKLCRFDSNVVSLLLIMAVAVRVIQFFQTVQKFYRFIGIIPLPSDQKFPLNYRTVAFSIMLTLEVIPTAAYFCFDAHLAIEKADSFYVTSTCVAIDCAYLISVWKCADIFKYIENFNAYIHSIVLNDLTLRAIYVDLNARIERMSEIIRCLLVTITLIGVVLPPPIITGINYFIYDMGDESYFLTLRLLSVTLKLKSHTKSNKIYL